MCLSQGVNEKLCAFPFSVLVADCNSPPTPHPLLLPPLLFSPPDRREVLITGAVDSAALGFWFGLYRADSLIKHANRIYRTHLNSHSPCKCRVVSGGLCLCLSPFLKNLIMRRHLM